MSIYDFSREELELIRLADADMDNRRGPKFAESEDAVEFNGGNPLALYRKMHGLTQLELSQLMYVSKQTIEDMERGKTPITAYVIEWMKIN